MPDKRSLRKRLRERLAALDARSRSDGSKAIFQKVTALPQYQGAQRVFAYYSIGHEVDTHAIIRHAQSMGKTVFLPAMIDRETMEFYPLTDISMLQPGPHGIPQPAPSRPEHPQPGDLMLLPGLSFTRSGERLGQGGGCYDRYLAAHDALTVGLCFKVMLSEHLPTENHDRRADFVVTD